MPTSDRMSLPYPALTDTPDAPTQFEDLVSAIETAFPALYGQGAIASRPISSVGTPGKSGRYYYATDTVELWLDLGTSWIKVGPGVSATEVTDTAIIYAVALGG
jgi:hypothetical protein